MMLDMFSVNRPAAPKHSRAVALSNGKRVRRTGERGAALVEFALIFPVLMILVLGLFSLGLLLNQYLELTDAVAVGGQYLADLRGNTTDPCANTVSTIEAAAPMLTPGSMTFAFSITSQTGTTPVANSYPSSTTTCTAGATELTQGQPVSIVVQYPCSLAVFNNANLLPGCTLTAAITEISQ